MAGPTNATSNVASSSVIDFFDYDDIPAAFLRLTAEISKLLKKADFDTLRRGMIVVHKMFLRVYSFLMICIKR